jgi:hypothetical protein
MEWNIGIQIFKISVISDNMNWLNRQLILHRNIDYLQVLFHSGKYIDIPSELKFKLQSGFPSTQNIIVYWESLLANTPSLKELKPYKLNLEYYLAPIYITRSIIILGILIPDSHYGKMLFSKLSMATKTNTDTKQTDNIIGFMSKIANNAISNRVNKKPEYESYNIIGGILEYFPFPEDKYFAIQDYNISISWKSIITNIRNYLPKIKITYLPPKTSSIEFFRNRLNPSY